MLFSFVYNQIVSAINKGRFTADTHKDFVLFLIGMRINKWWKVWVWLPVFIAMPLMLNRLKRNKESGLLESRVILYPGGAGVIQYWDSFENLEKFARDPHDLHTKHWARYRRKVGNSGDVGIWHETYLVKKDNFESVYVNMPDWGVGKAFDNTQVERNSDTARMRLYKQK